jgi:two-component system, cell cycle sensor histidine kinase and response regulator CckA
VLEGHTVHHESTKPVQGVSITFDVLKVPIADSSGKFVGICGIARDVTEKRRAEEQVRKSEEKYKALFDNSRDGIYITSLDGEIEEANPAFRNMFAFGDRELKGASVLDLYERPQDRNRFQREIEASGSLIDFELALRSRDGRRIDCLVSSSVRRNRDGTIIGYEGSIRDVTDRKVLEQQLLQAQKMEAIGTLAGGIAHDFNNILYAIIGFTELALDEAALSGRVKKYLAQVLKAGERAKYLVNQILTFSRQSEVEKRPVLIDPIVKEVCKFLRASLPATIDIHWKVSDHLSPVLADPNQIHQVLMNLCANAGHAMRRTAGNLNISLEDVELDAASVGARPDAIPGLYQRITVTDTGHGIDRNVLDRIFDPYFTTKEKGEGTGLGLAVVHGIVKAHRGIITVESRSGEGSAFSVYLPVVHQEMQPMTESHDRLKTGSECILVVDDEESITGMISTMLKRLGYAVVSRTSSVEALELFRNSARKFDLVITDMTMPNMTGKELAQKMRDIRGDIPIILCTGFSELMSEHQAKSMGIQAFLMKPVLREEMASTIRRVLEAQDEGTAQCARQQVTDLRR